MAQAARKLTRKTIIRLLVITFSFAIPLTSLIVCVVIFMRLSGVRPPLPGEEVAEGGLAPSEVLSNKTSYNRQELAIRGKVSPEPAVCEKRECPEEDPCCGCPTERNLIISDIGMVLTSGTQGRLRLLNVDGEPFCQRAEGSCEYDCQDWEEGVAYDVMGEFFAERPPPGWQMSLDFYFLVDGKERVRVVSFGESLKTMVGEIKEMISGARTSGYYVIE